VQELAPVVLLPVEAQVAVPPAEVAAPQVAPDHPAEVADRQVQQEQRRSLAGRW